MLASSPIRSWSCRQLLDVARHSLVQHTVAMAMVQAGVNFVPLITIPYVVRVLGVAGWGLVAFAQSFGMYQSVAGEYGFALSATREVARHRDDGEKLAGWIGSSSKLEEAPLPPKSSSMGGGNVGSSPRRIDDR